MTARTREQLIRHGETLETIESLIRYTRSALHYDKPADPCMATIYLQDLSEELALLKGQFPDPTRKWPSSSFEE